MKKIILLVFISLTCIVKVQAQTQAEIVGSGGGSGIATDPVGATTSATDDQTIVSNGTVFQAKTLPDCTDTSGQHINYTQATNTFSCGTSETTSAPFIDSTAIIKGSADATKLVRIEADGLTTATTRVLTPPDANIVIAGSSSALTSGRVPFATTGGLLTDSTDFTYSSGALSSTGGIATFGAASGLGTSVIRIYNSADNQARIDFRNETNTANEAYALTGSTGIMSIGTGGATAVNINTNDTARLVIHGTTGALAASTIYAVTPTAQSVADNGGGTAAAFNVAATVGKVHVTCNDANGCDATLLETNATDGAEMTVVNVSANAVNFADTAGVSETAGAFAAGQYDSITFDYVGDRWVERCRSNN